MEDRGKEEQLRDHESLIDHEPTDQPRGQALCQSHMEDQVEDRMEELVDRLTSPIEDRGRADRGEEEQLIDYEPTDQPRGQALTHAVDQLEDRVEHLVERITG